DGRIIKPHHQQIAIEPAGWQPVSGPRACRDPDLKRTVGAAHDLLAGEAVALQRVAHQLTLGVIQCQRPETRSRRDTADGNVATAIERPSLVIAAGDESDAVAAADRQL